MRKKTAIANWNGMNWIRQNKRFALYLRDDCRCVYCRRALGDKGVKMTLDHVVPRSLGGDNAADNLITACSKCNSKRGNLPVEEFADALMAMGADPTQVYSRLKDQLSRPFDVAAGRALREEHRALRQAKKEARRAA